MTEKIKALFFPLALTLAALLCVPAAAESADASKTPVPAAVISGYPSKGASPAAAAIGVSSEGADVKETVWLKNGEPMNGNEVFDGAFFGAYIVLEAKDGYFFPPDAAASAFGSACVPAGISADGRTAAFVTAEIDLVCTHNWVMTADTTASSESGTKSYTCVICESSRTVSASGETVTKLAYPSPSDSLIRNVTIDGIAAPSAGKTADAASAKADGSVTIVSAGFDSAEFECEKKSTVTLELKAADGRSFAPLPFASVNGYIAGITVIDASHATVSFTFPEPGHSFSDWYTDTEPGCTEEGVAERKCTVCFKSEEKPIAPSGHGEASLREGYGADCVSEGCISYGICPRCGAYLDEEGNEVSESGLALPIDPDVHAGGKTVCDAADPAAGHYVLCACGARLSPSSHSFGDYMTDEKSGTRSRTCTACGYTESEPISDKPGTVLIIIICAAVVLAALAAVFIGKKMKRGR